MVHLSLFASFVAAETHLIDTIRLIQQYPNSVNVEKLIRETDKNYGYFDHAKNLKECFSIATVLVSDTTLHANAALMGIHNFVYDNYLYNNHACSTLMDAVNEILKKRKVLDSTVLVKTH